MLKSLRFRDLFPIILAMAALTIPVSAHEIKAGDLTIEHPWTRATPAGAKTAGGYVRITNNGDEADRLIGGAADGAKRVEVHEMKVENNIMKMRKLESGLEIEAGETVELKPGSYHLMMMGLEEPYQEGAPVKGALTFEKAGTVEVEFAVQAMGETMDHGDSHKMNGDMKQGHAGGHQKEAQ